MTGAPTTTGLASPVDAALLVFDWDGTVIDSIATIAESIQRAAADLGLPVPDDSSARHVIGLGLTDALHQAVPTLGADQTEAFVNRYRYHYVTAASVDRPFDGIEALFESLQRAGRRLAVATGKSRRGLDRAFAETGFGRYFEASRCADEGQPKPHPWMLESLADETGCAPSTMVMIGDTSHDIALGRNAGAATVGVGYGAHDRDELVRANPDWLVDSVADLRRLLEQGPATGRPERGR